MVGYPPFVERPNKTLTQQVIEGSYTFPDKHWKNISEQAKDIIRRLLTVDPTKRITVAEALEHPWIKVRGYFGNLANMSVGERSTATFARINTHKLQQTCEQNTEVRLTSCLSTACTKLLEQLCDKLEMDVPGGGGGAPPTVALDTEVQENLPLFMINHKYIIRDRS